MSRELSNLKPANYNLQAMRAARIRELLQPFLDPSSEPLLTDDLLDHISTYIDILLRWNARVNLTAIRDPEEIITRHFGESLFTARHLFPQEKRNLREARSFATGQEGKDAKNEGQPPEDRVNDAGHEITLADLGSGAGFPGVPIKLWAPDITLTLIESNNKKVTFLREVVRALKLASVNVAATRAESLNRGVFDVVTLRAVERFESILPAAAALVAPGGRLVLLIGNAQIALARSVLAKLAAEGRPNFLWEEAAPVPQSKTRTIVVARAEWT
ncbi:MAG TPA: 16S rRNA (guanine(527)-N(7))-methyltransferase RsmG [Candidatus Sulfotelmatobacter sp.]|nr:16S rRNA (guanine(527)-N(7))-methyltransferase RsmG [Candidatus Sulfotelmatobacter sp.]